MADAALRDDFEFVEADMNYIVDDGVMPVTYVDWPEEEHKAHPPVYQPHKVKIWNGRLTGETFALPTHGFAFENKPSAVKDFYDEDHVKQVYYPETADLIKAHTGAESVLVFDHTIRTQRKELVEKLGVREPVKAVHNDYTEKSAPQRVRDLLPEAEAEQRLARRFAIVQTWRPITTIESEPLAMCDGRTIPEEGFILVQRRYSHRTAEVYHIAYNPEHRWIYFPRMSPDEVMVFKVFDTDRTAGVPFTAHSAFIDPTSAPAARPRESIEMRSLVFF
jgi:hypothetical protein